MNQVKATVNQESMKEKIEETNAEVLVEAALKLMGSRI